MVGFASWDFDSSSTSVSRDARRRRSLAEVRKDAPSPFPEDLRLGTVEVGPKRHRVARGDTFESIAQLYYGSQRYGNALWWINRGKVRWPEQLSAGDLLIVPAVGSVWNDHVELV